METLLQLLKEATAIQIDDNFIRYFNLNDEDGDDDYALNINFEDEDFEWQYEISFDEINNAVYDKISNTWKIQGRDLTIKVFNVQEIYP